MLSDRTALTFIFKALVLLLVLFAAGFIATWCLKFVDPSHREIVATLAGAGATMFAGWLAWESVTIQAKRVQTDKLERAIVRKRDAVVAVTQPIHAAAAWLSLLNKEIPQPGDREGKSLRAKRSARQLDQVLDRDLLLALINELGAEDRINLLMIIGTMRTALAMAEPQSFDPKLSNDDLESIRDVVSKLESHLTRFDRNLHQVFVRDSELKN